MPALTLYTGGARLNRHRVRPTSVPRPWERWLPLLDPAAGAWCDCHHRQHWSRGGATSLHNLITVCGYHHTQLHLSGHAIIARPDGRIELIPDPDHHPTDNTDRGLALDPHSSDGDRPRSLAVSAWQARGACRRLAPKASIRVRAADSVARLYQ
jgi:hypothetical protein